jgi:hypothetical protein
MEAWHVLAGWTAVAAILAVPVGRWLRHRREQQERWAALVDEVMTEPWRAPELGTGAHWDWCGLPADHTGRCHTRSCRYRRDHDGLCYVEATADA